MKRMKVEPASNRKPRLSHVLLILGVLYLIFITFKFPTFLEMAASLSWDEGGGVASLADDTGNWRGLMNSVGEDRGRTDEGGDDVLVVKAQPRYGRVMEEIMRKKSNSTVATGDFAGLEKMADEAWSLGIKAWKELNKSDLKDISPCSVLEGSPESCPSWVSVSGEELAHGDRLMFLPCGLAAGSSITIVGTPHQAHQEYVPQLAKLRNGDGMVYVSQFMVELQGI